MQTQSAYPIVITIFREQNEQQKVTVESGGQIVEMSEAASLNQRVVGSSPTSPTNLPIIKSNRRTAAAQRRFGNALRAAACFACGG